MRFSALLSFVLFVAACDSGDELTPVSTFPPEDTVARNLAGQVVQGPQPVEDALVLIQADPSLANDARLEATADPQMFPRTMATDANGLYRFTFAPLHYDISVRHARDVFSFKNVASRYFVPPVGPDAPIRGFKARIVPSTNPPPAAGHAVAYFVAGEDARTILPSSPEPFEATFRRFDTVITVHAVEYVASLGLASAVAEGQVDIRVVHGAVVSPQIAMTPITATRTVSFDVTPPPGYTLAPLEIDVDYTPRTSALAVGTVAPGASLTLNVATGAHYGVRATATKDGAASMSGRLIFDYMDTVVLKLPPPVSAESPIDDDAPPGIAPSMLVDPVLEPGASLSARISGGIIEHTLVPAAGTGAIIHVATAARATPLPDLARLGLPRATGRYVWTMECFPGLPRIENFAGEDARITPSSWKSAPRVIFVR